MVDFNSSTFIWRLELINNSQSKLFFGLSGPMLDLNSSTFIWRLELINNSQYKLLFFACLDQWWI